MSVYSKYKDGKKKAGELLNTLKHSIRTNLDKLTEIKDNKVQLKSNIDEAKDIVYAYVVPFLQYVGEITESAAKSVASTFSVKKLYELFSPWFATDIYENTLANITDTDKNSAAIKLAVDGDLNDNKPSLIYQNVNRDPKFKLMKGLEGTLASA